MLRRIASNLTPNTFSQRVLRLCLFSVLILTVSLVACAIPTSIIEPKTIAGQAPLLTQNPEPALEPAQATIPEPVPTLNPTTFQIFDLKINPTEVNSGEGFLITANLLNAGDSEATQTIELMVDNTSRLVTQVTLPAGETGELRVVGREEVPGIHLVNLNGLTEQFVVRESTETLMLSSPDPGTSVLDQDTTVCCGGSSNQGGCGCGGGSSSQSGCGCSRQ